MPNIHRIPPARGKDDVMFPDHEADKRDPWHLLEDAALRAHEILVEEAGAYSVPQPTCPPWAHKAAMVLLEAIDRLQDARHGAHSHGLRRYVYAVEEERSPRGAEGRTR